MSFVALKMLFGDRAKYLMLLAGLTFSTMLIVQQGSIFWGLMTWSMSGISNVNAPVWVTDPNINQVEEIKPLADTAVTRVRSVPGVEWAVPLYKGVQRARLRDGNFEQIALVGIDPSTLIGRPYTVLDGRIEELRAPETVAVDELTVERLGGPNKIHVGSTFEINDHRVRIVAIVQAQKSFQNIPFVYTTYERALRITPQERRKLSYVLVGPQPGISAEALAGRIQKETGLGAYSGDQFGWKTMQWVLKNTGIGVNFGTTVFLGFIVGMAIAGQTFYLFTVENLQQFGALKAIGASTGMLARMILLQSFTVGLIGYGIGIGLATLFGLTAGRGGVLPFKETWPLLLGVFVALMMICSLSSVISIRKLAKLEPAVVFRG
ncbi:MAG: FtsX-like permease family protein [Nitrospira sp.]|nr:FtsX-like permease family protein [Nitrospira sp.]MCB9711021.1 FtsX-like permease family protein [Nitrospiraceae bacterium]MDR4488187.1 ABC transporter permease [Nitrospirales bacterium]MCA9464861.1 FtsX-like permease family protein [Nitrospira sp.]MCA9480655.1 FtsX-like permease family protein [Nitrospira sp.]